MRNGATQTSRFLMLLAINAALKSDSRSVVSPAQDALPHLSASQNPDITKLKKKIGSSGRDGVSAQLHHKRLKRHERPLPAF